MRISAARNVTILAGALGLGAIAFVGTAGVGNTAAAAEVSDQTATMQEDGEATTVTGIIGQTTLNGKIVYTITVAGVATRLSAGPAWFYQTPPLAAFVGKTATITGERSTGERSPNAAAKAKANPSEGPSIDVFTITSSGSTTTLRSAGKPPWAGGPKAVGAKHPGSAKPK